MKKIGLLLGSFDPFHIGHKEAILKALSKDIDIVLIIPTISNPWKEKKPVDINTRGIIINLEIQDIPQANYFPIITPPEEDGKYYSVDQLKLLKKMFSAKGEFYIIGGPEVVNSISFWKEGTWILENFKILEIERPGFSADASGTQISSTIIRELIKDKNWSELKKYYTNKDTLGLLNGLYE